MKRSSKAYYSIEEERLQYKSCLEFEKNKDSTIRLAALLLDSSLIIQSKKELYNIKLVECGDYIQMYSSDIRMHDKKDLEPVTQYDLDDVADSLKDIDSYFNESESKNNKNRKKIKVSSDSTKNELFEVGEIEYRNIVRSRFELDRLVKTNEKVFKTFITLTFADNVTDINLANKKFNTWKTYIKQLKKDFSYVCVPEFQKRGAVHYHLLTNLDITKNPDIIISQVDEDGKVKNNCYDVKGWSYGFSSVKDLYNIKAVNYLAKYMTKDCDNRLYCHRRYFHSRNLKKPIISFLNTNNIKDFEYLNKCINNFKIQYTNKYIDYNNNDITFFEFARSQHNI